MGVIIYRRKRDVLQEGIFASDEEKKERRPGILHDGYRIETKTTGETLFTVLPGGIPRIRKPAKSGELKAGEVGKTQVHDGFFSFATLLIQPVPEIDPKTNEFDPSWYETPLPEGYVTPRKELVLS